VGLKSALSLERVPHRIGFSKESDGLMVTVWVDVDGEPELTIVDDCPCTERLGESNC